MILDSCAIFYYVFVSLKELIKIIDKVTLQHKIGVPNPLCQEGKKKKN